MQNNENQLPSKERYHYSQVSNIYLNSPDQGQPDQFINHNHGTSQQGQSQNQQPHDHQPSNKVYPDNEIPLTQTSQPPQKVVELPFIKLQQPQNIVQGTPYTAQIITIQQPPPNTLQQEILNQEQNTFFNRIHNLKGKFYMISLAFIFLFCPEMILERVLYGYHSTFILYLVWYQFNIYLVIQFCFLHLSTRYVEVGVKENKIVAEHNLDSDFHNQVNSVDGFFWIRYQLDNPPANDALSDYQDVYDHGYKSCDRWTCSRKEAPLVYSMYDTCRVLQSAFLEDYGSKSYAEYCQEVMSGQVDDVDFKKFFPLQIGILLYFAVGLLAALILSVYLGKFYFIGKQQRFKRPREPSPHESDDESGACF